MNTPPSPKQRRFVRGQGTGPSKSTFSVVPHSSSPEPDQTNTGLGNDLEGRIATRAYELWEQRGHQDGHDMEDWLEAEREIRGS